MVDLSDAVVQGRRMEKPGGLFLLEFVKSGGLANHIVHQRIIADLVSQGGQRTNDLAGFAGHQQCFQGSFYGHSMEA